MLALTLFWLALAITKLWLLVLCICGFAFGFSLAFGFGIWDLGYGTKKWRGWRLALVFAIIILSFDLLPFALRLAGNKSREREMFEYSMTCAISFSPSYRGKFLLFTI